MKNTSAVEWREFEQLVARLEIMLSGRNCKVKHNDQVRDRFGQLRQVDATVRVDSGSTPMLIIIECRKRNSISDVRWIEQVSSKRDNLRANMAICVSNNQLTPRAKKLADDKGIELRTLTTFDFRSIDRSLSSFPEIGTYSWSISKVGIHFGEYLLDQDTISNLARAGEDDQLSISLNGKSFPFSDFLKSALAVFEDIDLLPESDCFEVLAELDNDSSDTELIFDGLHVPVEKIRLRLLCQFSSAVKLKTRIGKYSSSSNHIDYTISESDYMYGGEKVTITIMIPKDNNSIIIGGPKGLIEASKSQGTSSLDNHTVILDFNKIHSSFLTNPFID